MALIEIQNKDLDLLKTMLEQAAIDNQSYYNNCKILSKSGEGSVSHQRLAVLSRRIALCKEIVSKIEGLKEGERGE